MTQVDPKIEKFIQETYPLMQDGDWDEVYRLAAGQYEFEVSALTQFLWDCDVHPELEGLTKIPKDFAQSLDIKTFRVPQGITSIGHGAFSSCRALTSIIIPDSVKSVGSFAFLGCSSLTTVSIPVSVASIGEWAFARCTSLKGIIFEGTKEQWEAIKKDWGWRSRVGNLLVLCKDGEVRYE